MRRLSMLVSWLVDLLAGIDMQMPGEYLVGFSILGMGLVTFIGAYSERSWKAMCMGPWKFYDTPFYRAVSKWGAVCCMAIGVGVLTGLIRP